MPLLEPHHRVVALERPWAGVEASVDATLAALDDQAMARAVLVGHSAGAEVALALAGVAPERVAGLVLLAPVLGGGPPPIVGQVARLPGTAAVAPALLRLSMRAFAPALRMAWFDRSLVTAEVVDGYRRPLLEPGVAEALWAMTAERGSRHPTVDPPPAGVPCLVMTGDHDKWATPVPGAHVRRVVVERCGHMPHEEHPLLVAEEILAFTSALTEPPPA